MIAEEVLHLGAGGPSLTDRLLLRASLVVWSFSSESKGGNDGLFVAGASPSLV